MPTTQQREQHNDMEKHKGETVRALIGEQVIHTLGRPDRLLRVQVQLLWKNYYRVNVFVGEDAVSAKVVNSYFLEADGDGNIVESNPKITRRY